MQHLLLDLYECNVQKLSDVDALRGFLNELPGRLGMEKTSQPSLYFIDAVTNPDDAGHSGLILTTNHVSLHAWPPYQMINIDIFARDAFDEAEATAFARAMFEPGDVEVHSIQRGTRSPRQRWVADQPVVSGIESKAEPLTNGDRCLYQGPGGRCTRATSSALMRYCTIHQDLLLPP